MLKVSLMAANILESLEKFWQSTGLAQSEIKNYIMIIIACVLLVAAIKYKGEHNLHLPIAFGMLLINMPGAYDILFKEPVVKIIESATGTTIETVEAGGLLYYFYQGVDLVIFPPIIFLGIGVMTDFGPLIANPKSLILGAAAQLGIFITFLGAKFLGFDNAEASAIGIIGGAGGPTAIFFSSKPPPHLLSAISVPGDSFLSPLSIY